MTKEPREGWLREGGLLHDPKMREFGRNFKKNIETVGYRVRLESANKGELIKLNFIS